MYIPTKLRTNRAFAKKALNFIKYYPLKRKDPLEMLKTTLIELERLVDKAKSIEDLEPLSHEVKSLVDYPRPDELFQIEVIGEKNRFIVYYPSKFFETNKDPEKIAYIYDFLYIPRESSY